MDNIKKLELTTKGIAHWRRIKILFVISHQPGLTLSSLAERIKTNFYTTQGHIKKLEIGGLILKRQTGPNVQHYLTKLGRQVARDLKAWLTVK